MCSPGDTFKDYLSSQGFTNVQNEITKWPCTPWPEDEVGKTLEGMHRQNILMGVEGISMMLLTKQLGLATEGVDDLVQKIRQELEDL